MKGLILLENYFEDIEAIATIDIIRRANIKIDTISLSTKKLITQSKIIIEADYLINEINYNNYDFLIIPGGKAVMNSLIYNNLVNEILNAFKNKLICLICAAPILLKEINEFTCFKGFENKIKGKYLNKGVVRYKNIITAKSCAYTIDFALEIINYLTNSNTNVKNEIYSI